MKKENFIKSSFNVLMISLFNVLMISLVSCERVIIEAPNNQGSDDDEVAAYTFRLLAPSTTRATTATDFKVIYAFDIVNGSVSQYIEQKSTDNDFGTITLDPWQSHTAFLRHRRRKHHHIRRHHHPGEYRRHLL